MPYCFLIEKDVCRTDRNLEYFSGDSNPNLQILQDILMTYVMYNFDLGYVQGMSDLLSPLLMLLNDEVDAFWCFAGLMKKVVNIRIILKDLLTFFCELIYCFLFSGP